MKDSNNSHEAAINASIGQIPTENSTHTLSLTHRKTFAEIQIDRGASGALPNSQEEGFGERVVILLVHSLRKIFTLDHIWGYNMNTSST
jgi:hypothetical protein